MSDSEKESVHDAKATEPTAPSSASAAAAASGTEKGSDGDVPAAGADGGDLDGGGAKVPPEILPNPKSTNPLFNAPKKKKKKLGGRQRRKETKLRATVHVAGPQEGRVQRQVQPRREMAGECMCVFRPLT